MRAKIISKKSMDLERPFWWRRRSEKATQRFRGLEEVIKEDVSLRGENRYINDVLFSSLGRNILVFFFIHDIKRFKLDLKLIEKRISLYYFKRGQMKTIFPGKIHGSYIGIRVCTTLEEMEEIFEWLTEFPHYLEVSLIRFGNFQFFSFHEFFDELEKGFGSREEFRHLIHQKVNPFVLKKREELLHIFFLTLIFYEEYLRIIFLYFLRWLR